MSYEIKSKLDGAKDKISDLQSSYGATGKGYRYDASFIDLMSNISEFITDQIDEVYTAMDEAVDEIGRLDDENDELRERIEELEKQLEEIEEVANG